LQRSLSASLFVSVLEDFVDVDVGEVDFVQLFFFYLHFRCYQHLTSEHELICQTERVLIVRELLPHGAHQRRPMNTRQVEQPVNIVGEVVA